MLEVDHNHIVVAVVVENHVDNRVFVVDSTVVVGNSVDSTAVVVVDNLVGSRIVRVVGVVVA